ncbi:HNH endonuclease [Paraconexibacter sp. AEG42_29]|uniref:HNH endonuclease n=1 Tax=Paraconexibacter sp. AEG42_29 TaxID=2997339 RepID=A0AAU7B0I9_9ACTN
MNASSTGNSFKVLQKYVAVWGIPVDHFDRYATTRARSRAQRVPLEEILATGRPFSRRSLKARLFEEGYKTRACELCGQGELWRGKSIALILDHVNGVPDDNRLANLRIVCPNCAATLETHCGRNARAPERPCAWCGDPMRAPSRQRYCSRRCAGRARSGAGRPATRKVERPPLAQIVAEVDADGWERVGRRYGVSGNAVRKWVRAYEAAEGPREGRPA